jgi:hypothetical protein
MFETRAELERMVLGRKGTVSSNYRRSRRRAMGHEGQPENSE